MIGLRLADAAGVAPRIADLFGACFPTEKAIVLALAAGVDEPW